MQSSSWYKREQMTSLIDIFSSLSYHDSELNDYLNNLVHTVSKLLALDWSVVTICSEDKERVMASSLELVNKEQIYSLHGSLTNTVVKTGKTLCVEDAQVNLEHGSPPFGYRAYIGIPLRTYQGEVIGTVCSFCQQSRLFTEEDVNTLEIFAQRAATAIQNYLLYQREKAFNKVLEAEVLERTKELKIAQAQLIERERLAAIGEFASMIVHEIRNPVTTIVMGLKYCQKTYLATENQERLTLALDEAKRLENLLQEILLYAKPQTLNLDSLDIDKLIKEIIPSLSQMPEAQGRELKLIPLAKSVKIRVDKDKFKQVLINLVRNAAEAIETGEQVTCKVEATLDLVYLSVHNGGNPIPADILPKLPMPFCSTKPEGTGLGLAIVKKIVHAHQGSLSIESTKKIGTIVKVSLPIHND